MRDVIALTLIRLAAGLVAVAGRLAIRAIPGGNDHEPIVLWDDMTDEDEQQLAASWRRVVSS